MDLEMNSIKSLTFSISNQHRKIPVLVLGSPCPCSNECFLVFFICYKAIPGRSRRSSDWENLSLMSDDICVFFTDLNIHCKLVRKLGIPNRFPSCQFRRQQNNDVWPLLPKAAPAMKEQGYLVRKKLLVGSCYDFFPGCPRECFSLAINIMPQWGDVPIRYDSHYIFSTSRFLLSPSSSSKYMLTCSSCEESLRTEKVWSNR